jgi:hypothetical protein
VEAHVIGRSLASALFLAFEVRGERGVASAVTAIEGLDDCVALDPFRIVEEGLDGLADWDGSSAYSASG